MNPHEITPLQVRVGQGQPRTLRTSPASLGRTPDNEIVVDHPLVSRRQLSIEWSGDGRWHVIDAGSTNGMYVGGIRQTVVTVAGGARINLGDAQTGPVLELTLLRPAAPTMVPPSGPTPAPRPAPSATPQRAASRGVTPRPQAPQRSVG
ncbi:FHA domain-containing protein, partial [Gordonia sp. (in: high G+C Gram-positive bacteria)]|uniref:FHA domain-containing protein n=1 Tax=Gordonia sp. (in: high G+C Gram-positive bacteria) TaxID=84139 RepID=UPI003F9AAE29